MIESSRVLRLLFASSGKGEPHLYTAVWSVLHYLVDFVCAWAMYAYFGAGNYENLLIYNFCAFALQLPFGTLLDLCREKHHKVPAIFAMIGVVATLCGTVIHPALLGIGNALFHVGAGVDVMEEDFDKNRKGRDLGIFVAPGAIGLYFGAQLGKMFTDPVVAIFAGVIMVILIFIYLKRVPVYDWHISNAPQKHGKQLLLTVCCFAVVVVRSFVGLSVTFSWKSVPLLCALAVTGTALGKCFGGFLAARFGIGRTAVYSLLLASVFYSIGNIGVFGLVAIFLFNMTMPLTLYLLAENLPGMRGFSFGLLTFGLFLGFLPVYWQTNLAIPPEILGAIGSVISCVLLIMAGKAAKL